MANSLPGPITPKMSFFTGYKVAGITGAGVCVLGLIIPSLFLMCILTSLYMRYKDLPSVKGLLKAVKPVVVALLALVIYNISPSSVDSWHTALIAVVTFCLLAFLNIHPAVLILGAAMLGVAFYR
jgi:chromate transporter